MARRLVVDVRDMQDLESRIACDGTTLRELMRRAGAAVANVVRDASADANESPALPDIWRQGRSECTSSRVVILAGCGNNGGDGWVAAETLASAGCHVTLFTPKPADEIRSEPARSEALGVMKGISSNGQPLLRVVEGMGEPDLRIELSRADYVVDAMLGVGFSGDFLKAPFDAWAAAVSEARDGGAFVVAVDVPSGLNAQTGDAVPGAVKADVTVTMMACKPGLLKPQARQHVGKLICADLSPYVDTLAERMGIARGFSTVLEEGLLRQVGRYVDAVFEESVEQCCYARRISEPSVACVAAAAPMPEASPTCEIAINGFGELLDSLDEPFSTTLLKIIDSCGLTDAQVYKRANMSRQLFSKIRSDANYRPAKRTVLALAVALELTLDETKDLLERAGFALSHASKADVIVEYFLTNGIYDLFLINEALYAFDQPLL